ncbi:MAG: hypothetical protein R3F11_20500 [Verrucomicrobiales bacterium]
MKRFPSSTVLSSNEIAIANIYRDINIAAFSASDPQPDAGKL